MGHGTGLEGCGIQTNSANQDQTLFCVYRFNGERSGYISLAVFQQLGYPTKRGKHLGNGVVWMAQMPL